jgi:hypothetical protein
MGMGHLANRLIYGGFARRFPRNPVKRGFATLTMSKQNVPIRAM